jgi:hypothetical protein
MHLINFFFKKKNYNFTFANIYYYFVTLVTFIFTFAFSIHFYNFILINKNIAFFLSFFYVICISIIFSLFTKKNFILINFISLFFFGLFIFELFFQISFSKIKNKDLLNYDQYINKIENENFYPIIYPRYILENNLFNKANDLKVFPLSGISNQKTILCNENNFWSTYTSDNYGFNNSNTTWEKEIKIAVFGDSFSHGNCVLSENQWIKKLQKKIPGTLNLSMGGNGPLMILATIKEYYKFINPEIVIWQYFESHDTRIPLEKNNEVLKKYLYDEKFKQNLVNKQQNVDDYLLKIYDKIKIIDSQKPVVKKLNFKEIIKQIIFLQNFRTIFGILKIDFKQSELDLDFILSKASKYIGKNKKFFFYIPSYYSVVNKKSPSNVINKKVTLNIAKKNNFKIISADLALKNHKNSNELYPHKNAHFNKNGYNIIFKIIEKCLAYYEINTEKNFCEPKTISLNN